MPSAARFQVNPQPAQENHNPADFNTNASFYLPGSQAAKIQSRRKRKTLAPLAPALWANQMPHQIPIMSFNPSPDALNLHPQFSGYNQENIGHAHPHTTAPYTPPIYGPPDPSSLHVVPDMDVDAHMTGANSVARLAPRPPQLPLACTPFTPQRTSVATMGPIEEDPGLDAMDTDPREPSPTPTINNVPDMPAALMKSSSQASICSDDLSDSGSQWSRSRKTYTSRAETVAAVEKLLHDAYLTPTTLLIYLLENASEDSSGDSLHARSGKAFYRSTNKQNVFRLLELIMANRKGHEMLDEWMDSTGQALPIVCNKIVQEMEDAKIHLRMSTNETTPEFVETWDVNTIMDPVAQDVTPTWTAILTSATESRSALQKAKDSSAYALCRRTTRNIISAQVHYQRSCKSSKVQIGLGLMASTTGASRNLINVLQKSGLSVSYCSINNIITSLHKYSLERAKTISQGPHAFCYDNINLSTSTFVEQRPDAMSKVQTGTFAVLYELQDIDSAHLKLAPIVERFKNARMLTMADLRPTRASSVMYLTQTRINITHILFKYSNSDYLKELAHDDRLQHTARRAPPKGLKTRFYPLAVSTIEEATVKGNIQVHDNVYIEQLGHEASSECINERAIPCLNDQLTNARIRGVQGQRAKDVNAWERREIFQLAFGTFHLVMNLIWALLHTHRGHSTEHGSLVYYFSLLEKARLGCERPDYHTLLATLTQILDGLILNAWRLECGYTSLGDFAASSPTPDDLLNIANSIITKYATPKDVITPTEVPSKRKADRGKAPTLASPTADYVHENTILLTRDLLYVMELVRAMSSGDFGRIEDILPQLACMFRGAGSNNYSTEVLHLLFNLKRVWTPEFADVMRDIMLVNPSGLEGHYMAIDMNIEHLIGYLKALFASKGLYSNWDRLGSISGAINYLQLIKKRVVRSLKTSYQGSTHRTPDTSALVWRIANKARELRLQEYEPLRKVQSKPVPDVHRIGYRKFETASLASFNKKLSEYRSGRTFESEEVDDLPLADFSRVVQGEDEECISLVAFETE